jgi:hypothetical protein
MLAIVGLVIALTLAGFSAGLAHGGVAIGGGYLPLEWQHGFPVSTASPANEFRFDCLLTLGALPAPMPAGASDGTVALALPAPAVGTFYSPPPRTRKVALHLFDSILLI